MSPDEVARTVYSRWWKGVKKNHVGAQSRFQLVGADTETCYGKVFSMGVKTATDYRHFYGHKRDFFRDLLGFLFDLPNQKKTTVVVGFHYLPFDASVLLFPLFAGCFRTTPKAPKQLHFSLIEPRCEIYAAMGKPCFIKIRRDKVTYTIIDTFSFFPCKLETALESIGGPVRKLDTFKKDKLFGKRIIPKREVAPYQKADAEGVYALLAEIIGLHEEYSTRLCVSLPMLAGKIFRHTCLKEDFVRLPAPVLAGALLSYHGGKNYPQTEMFKTGKVKSRWYRNVYDVDIKSAFPEAMRQLPNFEAGKWIETRKLSEALKRPHGVYKVWGETKDCPWGSIFSHDFKKIAGTVQAVWITGYELIEAVKSKEFRCDEIRGYHFVDDGGQSAFKIFVDRFFALKESAPNKVKRNFYKLILNSLYGKFIQRNLRDDGNREAGSMFDPAVATLITGYVRAKIHRLEHKYKSLHTATDGFITKIKPDPEDLGESLGCLTSVPNLNVLIIRNKLYLLYNQKGELVKKGLHGYQGKAEDLLKLWTKDKKEYRITRLASWAEAFNLGVIPGMEINREMELRI